MSSQNTLASRDSDDRQRLVERISDLEQDLWNARRLHLTIERNNRLFEALLASSTEGIALTRLDGTLIRVIRSIAGHVGADLVGLSVFDFIHPEDTGRMLECYRQIAAKRVHKIEHECRLLKRDGSSVWVAGTITDMLDDPAVQAIVHNYRSVSERKDAELAAAEFAAVIQQAPFAAFSKRVTGEILTWNQGAREMFGYEAGEIIGQSISVLVPPALWDEERHRRSLVVEKRVATPKFQTLRLRKDGTLIPIELVLSPLIAGGRVEGVAHLSYRRDSA